MLRLFCVSALLVLVVAKDIQVREGGRTTLDVYYESLCPDSRRFIMTQLFPSWNKINSFVNVRLVPFGKASFTPNAEGGYDFECQHGPAECQGNRLHACGLKYSANSTQNLIFARCLMESPDQGAMCASKAGLDFAVLDNCQNSVESQLLHQSHGVETLNLEPKLTFVPWLVFNGQWTDESQWDGLLNLSKVACRNALARTPACIVEN